MRIHQGLSILSILVAILFVMSALAADSAVAAGNSAKKSTFKDAQTKADRILKDAAGVSSSGVAPAQQATIAGNPPVAFYTTYPPGGTGPVYTWFIPAQPAGQRAGQAVAGTGDWRTPAGQGTAAPQQGVAASQANPPSSGWGPASLCYWLPRWGTGTGWNAPATSSRTVVPTYNQLARPGTPQALPGAAASSPMTVCYSGCVPSWTGPGYTTGTVCAPACY
ncbi:MAG: hypothetical protein HY913_14410 [Desulfomonile tiedjei]|nr:hypothetical protein [Desulfomonile tiedjei]